MGFVVPPSAGGGLTPARVIASGNYYMTDQGQPAAVGFPVTANRMYLVPFSRGIVVDALVVFSFANLGTARAGLYSCNAAGYPDALLVESGGDAVAATTVMGIADTTISEPVWLAVVFSSTPTIAGLDPTDSTTGTSSGNVLGATAIENNIMGYTTPQVFGPLASSLSAAVLTPRSAGSAMVDLRVRSA